MKYEIHFRHRQNGTLDDVFEIGEAKNKKAAITWGKNVAKERGWWFIGARVMLENFISRESMDFASEEMCS